MLINLIFPPLCASCGLLGQPLCPKCLKALKTTKPTCLTCENTCSLEDQTCPSGKRHERRINISFWEYNETAARIIATIKYVREAKAVLEFLTHAHPQVLVDIETLVKNIQNPTLVPVPLYPEREKERGFNQSILIAQTISAMVGIPITTNVVERIKPTRQQATARSRQERTKNMEGVFVSRNKKKVATITPLIVDDVVTTGSTIRAIEKALGRPSGDTTYSICLARENRF